MNDLTMYGYKGFVPYGAGEAWQVNQWSDYNPLFGWDGQNVTAAAIKNGCRFEIVDEKNAFLIPPAGAVDKIHFIRHDSIPYPMEEQPDGSFLVR